MTWHITDSVDDFLAGAGEFLRASPVENTLLLTVSETVRERGPNAFGAEPPIFGWCDGGAFLRTPPRAAVLSAMSPAAAADLAGRLGGTPLPAVAGPDAVAEAFSREWQRRTGATPRVTGRMRLFRLGALVPPTPPAPGRARVAGPGDRGLLLDWTNAFLRELGEPPTADELVDDRISYGGLRLWEVDGEPVSMAGATRRDAGMVRVLSVYTPPEHRTRGYAGAVTVSVSQAALDAGASDVVLFTDLANPTSNALYQRIGYLPIEDRSVVEFAS
ncbi:GNAT family N-acetyltransferase [Amorphoplanes digitatis]|uniref:GNAT superfamily N-acetyltransferase n=1 Tax=Actinoplanes digitatis TaxID=1868 RepID=A0A7W7I543_9ACTN|nr:GNAT family N-acetyltransferase [Actinoplanes digitatis]MBB4766592.1 GNAT superfamily N-acetyltransferase [Actinoplanes digitatis]GID96991.1 N-acetyltransferase [Actinoplanes digitatis]